VKLLKDKAAPRLVTSITDKLKMDPTRIMPSRDKELPTRDIVLSEMLDPKLEKSITAI